VISDSGPAIALRMQGISRSFPGVKALQDVDFTVLAGEVHALVGENGAGKSTLMAVAAGSLSPDTGTVWIGNAELRLGVPKSARELGLRIVRQHPALVPDLSVGENLALGVDPEQRVLRSDVNDWARQTMSRWGMITDPRRPIGEIPLPHQFVVEITKATLGEPKVLILDEPTEHLAAADVDLLYGAVEDLRATGTGIVYISHRIREVQRFASRLTVLRDGQTRGTFQTADATEAQIVTLALGRSLAATFPTKNDRGGEPVLEVRGLSGRGFTDVDLHVRRGEILGLAGIEGSGQRGVLSALAGTEPARGSVMLNGTAVRLNSIRSARRRGVSYVPEDRHNAGLFLSVGVGENVIAGVAPRHTRFGFINRRSMNTQASAVVDDYHIKTPSLATPISSLSGGNQQKTLLARSALENPRVLIADEPTQGVDAGARVQIYQALRDLCDDGSSVVVLSSDAVEMAGLCDRVLVFSRGHVVRELDGDELSAHRITESALTSTVLRGGGEQNGRRLLAGARGWVPAAVVAIALIVLGILAAAQNSRYATSLNLSNLLTLFAPLAFVAMGQLFALILGGIDLSVGPLMGLTVVACSFMIPPTGGIAGFCMALLTAIVVGLAAGLVNGLLITKVGMSPVVATLATYMAVLGLGQIARPTPAGIISNDFTKLVQGSLGAVPIAAIVAVAIAVALELALRRTGWGMRLRATGSDAVAAGSMGISVTRCRIGGYLLAALFAALAGVLLSAQTGIGDPASGTSFTFASVTAVILGGASIYGGRGSFIGAVLGAGLVAQIDNVTTFLHLSSAWQYWLLAILTISAAGIYSRIGQVTP
jgi:ribose transport system ATP-binding protein